MAGLTVVGALRVNTQVLNVQHDINHRLGRPRCELPPSSLFLWVSQLAEYSPSFSFLNVLLNVILLAYPTLSISLSSSLQNQQPYVHNIQAGTHTHPAWTAQLAQQPFEPVSFAMVMYGSLLLKKGLLALKTVLMHISRRRVHIVCSSDAIPILRSKLSLFSR